MSFKDVLFSFDGRIRRAEFWQKGVIGIIGMSIAAMALAVALGMINEALAMIAFLIYIPMVWSAFAIYAKRYHDRGKSGWWALLTLVPLLNLWALIECGFLEGSQGENAFGADPKDGEAAS